MNKLTKSSVMATLLLSSSLLASDNFFEIGAGYGSIKDNFSTEGDEKINSLGEASSERENLPNISFFYGYDLDEDNTIYSSMEEGDLRLGYETFTDIGMFDMGLVYTVFGEEEWENPFLTGTKRNKTDVSEIGGYLSYGMQWNENFESVLTYQLTKRDYDKETVSEDLKREGNRHIISLENEINGYMVNLNYELYDADGKQSKYNQYTVEVGKGFQLSEKLSLFTMASLGQKNYDEKNSAVNKKIDATIYSLGAQARYEEPLGYKNTYATFNLGYENEDANHDFYDKSGTYAMIGIGYSF